MSFASRNPFALLDDDEGQQPQVVAPVKKAAESAAPAKPKTDKPDRRPRGEYQRGGPRNVYKGDDRPTDGANGTEEEGGRGGRGRGRGRGRGEGRGRGGRGGGGRRRDYDKPSHSGTLPDSEKKEHQGWGVDDPDRELEGESAGAKDAAIAENADETAVDAVNGSAETAPNGTAPAEERPATPDDSNKTYEEYLAEKNKAPVIELPELRKANEGLSDLFKDAKVVEKKGTGEEDDLFGLAKNKAGRQRAKKEGKTFIEIETTFAPPERGGRDGRGRGGKGPRTDNRGKGGERGRGEGRARGGGRGRGGKGDFGGRNQQSINVDDSEAFPSLS